MDKGYWQRESGGCGLGGCNPFCCDDEFRHTVTGEKIKVFSTLDAHLEMPSKVADLNNIVDGINIVYDRPDLSICSTGEVI